MQHINRMMLKLPRIGRLAIRILGRLIFLLIIAPVCAEDTADNPRVELRTSKGNMVIELFADRAPATVENFLTYVNAGFYEGTIIHRAVYDWIIQGGGYDRFYQARQADAPVKSEADNGLKNTRGTIAMARHSAPDSADSQFFINLDNNESLDYVDDTDRGRGYCVFGQVLKGLEVADEISQMEKQDIAHIGVNVPVGPVVIEEVVVLSDE